MIKNDIFLNTILTEGVSFFGFEGELPSILLDKSIGRLDVFSKKEEVSVDFSRIKTRPLNSLTDISRYGASVCFLNGRSKRVLLAKYPNGASFVAVRVEFKWDWLIALVGILRRLKMGSIKIYSFKRLKKNTSGSSTWLIIKNTTSQVDSPIYLSVSENVGLSGLLKHLARNNVNYVVPRFFESFPELYRPNGGDLDILVHDDDAYFIQNFLKDNPGRIPVDVHTVFGPAPGSGDMPYYFPKLALAMLENSTKGPIGCNIPNDKDYFLSFLYHILFHKGFFSGVPSTRFPDYENAKPENDYLSFSLELSKAAKIEYVGTMEDAERILSEAGYIPKIDTLAAIARVNTWVKRRYFEDNEIIEKGVSVLILKEIASTSGWIDSIIRDFEAQNFQLIREVIFTKKEVSFFSSVLRGGNWYVPLENKEQYLPHSAYILLDKQNSGSYAASGGTKESRIRLLKEALRSKYDNSLHSFIHATDDTSQAYQYIEDIWGEEKEKINKEIDDFICTHKPVKVTYFNKARLKMHILIERLKQAVLIKFE
jgi:hypothetical protein